MVTVEQTLPSKSVREAQPSGPPMDSRRLPRIRDDIQIRRDSHGILVRSRDARRTFSIGELEFAALSLCDGNNSVSDIKSLLTGRLSTHDVEKLLLLFTQIGILQRGDAAPRARSVVSIRLLSFDVSNTLKRGWLTKLISWLLPITIAASLALTVVVIRHHGGDAFNALFNYHYLSWNTIWIYLVSVVVIGTIHEFCHAALIVEFGGSVFELGFMLNYFHPTFYVDVTGIDRLPRLGQRAAVWAAGVGSQVALLGPGLWLQFVAHPGEHLMGFLTIFNAVNAALIVFNLFFVIKLDGYYLLSELVGIRGLRERAIRFIRNPNDSSFTQASAAHRLLYGVIGIVMTVYLPVLAVSLAYFISVDLVGVSENLVEWYLLGGLVASLAGLSVRYAIARTRRVNQ